jgi:hypothetical protein
MIINIRIEVVADGGSATAREANVYLPEARAEFHRWIRDHFGYGPFRVRDLRAFHRPGSGRQWAYKVLREFERDGLVERHGATDPVTWTLICPL